MTEFFDLDTRAEQSERDLAIKCIRGVGLAAPDLSANSVQPLLTARNVSLKAAQEINWSWQEFIPDYRDGSPFVSFQYLRRLGVALRTAAVSGFSSARSIDRAHTTLIAGLQYIPFLLILAFIVAVIGWLPIAISIVIGILSAAFGALVLGLCTQSPWTASVRAVVLPLAWPLIFIVSLPGTLLSAILGVVLAWLVLPRLLVVSIFPKHWMYTIGVHDGIPDYDTAQGELIAFIVLVACAVATWYPLSLVHKCLHRALAPILKILADVILYVGDANYRNSLLNCVEKSMRESLSAGTTHFLLLSHSLGTVISVDVLRFRFNESRASVTLITGGSPLSKLFHRFLPASYPSPTTLLDYFRLRFKAFTWVNVYRPNDPIGTSLGLARPFDVSTEQHSLPWTRAHLDYWKDPLVHSKAHEAMRQPTTEPAKCAGADELVPAGTCLPAGGSKAISTSVLSILFVFFSALVTFWIVRQLMAPVLDASRTLESVARSSVTTSARVLTSTTTEWYVDDNGPPTSHTSRNYELAFDGSPPVVLGVSDLLCRTRKLDEAFKAVRFPQVVPHPITGKPVSALEVTIRYSPGKSNMVIIDQCAREKVSIAEWIGYGLVGVSVGGFTLYLLLGLGAALVFIPLAAFVAVTEPEYSQAKRGFWSDPGSEYFEGLGTFFKFIVYFVLPVFLLCTF